WATGRFEIQCTCYVVASSIFRLARVNSVAHRVGEFASTREPAAKDFARGRRSDHGAASNTQVSHTRTLEKGRPRPGVSDGVPPSRLKRVCRLSRKNSMKACSGTG